MSSTNELRMTPTELRASFSLATIFAIRLLGLFIILPVFSLYAQQLARTTPFLIGIAIGSYGLTQGLLQIPFGMWSDRIGRKPVIFLGLILFCGGSLVAALSHSILGIIIGRTLQGAGAVGSATIALAADLTRENQRTKAMAMIGISIGFAFAAAMVIGPLLSQWVNVPGLFGLTALLGIVAMGLLSFFVPNPPLLSHQPSFSNSKTSPTPPFLSILTDKKLVPFYIGIFLLHAILTGSFIVIPIALQSITHLPESKQWYLYLPALIFASVITLTLLRRKAAQRPTHKLMLISILILGLSEILFVYCTSTLLGAGIGLFLFFSAFTLLEACLPAFISLSAPVISRGTAMGIFSSSQFLGIFVGGLGGGWLYGIAGIYSLFIASALLCGLWLILNVIHPLTPPPLPQQVEGDRNV